MAGHWCPIIHRVNPKTHVDVQKQSIEGDQSGAEIISTSCTCSDIRSWFSVIVNHLQPQN